MIKITGQLIGEVEIKRFYLEGLDIEYACPSCGVTHEFTDYLSYPYMNEINIVDLYCHECSHEWEERIKLNISVEKAD